MQRGVSNWLTVLEITHFCSNYQNNIFAVQFAYAMDEVLQIYQEHAVMVVNFVYSMIRVSQGGFTSIRHFQIMEI